MTIRQQFHEFKQNSIKSSPVNHKARNNIRRISIRLTGGSHSKGKSHRKQRLSNAFFGKPDQTLEQNIAHDLRSKETVGDEQTFEHTDNVNNTLIEDIKSSNISSIVSYEQNGTPISKTKKFNDGLQVWINKIHYYQKHKFYHIFGLYKKQDNFGEQDVNRSEDSFENLPEDAYSCYNRYRTLDFNTCFEALEKRLNNEKCPENFDDSNVPVFSPLNESTFDSLQVWRDKVFGLHPEFPDDSLLSLEEFNGKATEKDLDEKVQKSSIPMDGEALSSDKALLRQNDTECDTSQSDPKIQSPIPDNIKHLFQDSSETDDEAVSSELKTELEVGDLSSSDDPKTYNSVLAEIEPNRPGSIHRKRSVIQRVKSAFRGSASPNSSLKSESTGSSYSPVSIVIPALNNQGFILDISGDISEGTAIDSVYFPTDGASSMSTDENTPIDIRNPNAYNTHTYSHETNARPPSLNRSPVIDTTIKFDKFAQILLYDGSKRLKRSSFEDVEEHPIDSKSKLRKRQEHNKNNGTLVLTPSDSVRKLKSFRKSRFSKESTNALTERQLEEKLNADNSVKPILKSKHNKNADMESIRARYCDDVEVEEFISFFEEHEKKRIESEPYLDRAREKQVVTYYSSESVE